MSIWFLAPVEGMCCDCRPNVCDSCCDCSPATLVQRSVTASLSKCGFDEWPGYVSTPPKRYLDKTFSGFLRDTVYAGGSNCTICVTDDLIAYSGVCNYTAPTCGTPNFATFDTTNSTDCISNTNSTVAGCAITPSLGGGTNTSYSGLIKTVAGTGACIASEVWTGTATETLSSEYTSAQLKTYTEAALPAYSGPFTPNSAFGYGVYDTDETSYSARQSEYKFVIPTSNITGCNSYEIGWDITLYPTSGGSSILATFNYVWDGVSANSPTYTVGDGLSVPGEVVVSNIAYICT